MTYVQVLARGVECDIALLSVENEEFWKGAESLQLGHLPRLQVVFFVLSKIRIVSVVSLLFQFQCVYYHSWCFPEIMPLHKYKLFSKFYH